MKYKHLSIENIPEQKSKSYQLFVLCVNQCDWEDGLLNRMTYGSDIAVFSLSYLVKNGFYKTVIKADENVHDDFLPLLNICVHFSKRGRAGGAYDTQLFTAINKFNDLVIVHFVPIKRGDWSADALYGTDLTHEEQRMISDLWGEAETECMELYQLMQEKINERL